MKTIYHIYYSMVTFTYTVEGPFKQPSSATVPFPTYKYEDMLWTTVKAKSKEDALIIGRKNISNFLIETCRNPVDIEPSKRHIVIHRSLYGISLSY